MDETDGDLEELQRVLDASAELGGDHLQSAFSQAERPSASDVTASLRGIFEMHFAVVASDGAPLVAPIDGIFYRGNVWLGIPAKAVRARVVRRDPRVSASYIGDDLAFIVHGWFRETPDGDPRATGFGALARSLYVERYGDWFAGYLDDRMRTEGPGLTGYIEPRRLFVKR